MPFEIVRNDITKMNVDAIVNAANRSLLGGGGVDGAIHRAAGPELLAECRTLGGCETGEAKITKGYRLPARYVIHTVGPIWHGYPKEEAMTVAVETITSFLEDHDLTAYLVVFGHTEFMTGKALYRDVREYIDDVYARSHVRKNLEKARGVLWHADEQAAMDLDMEISPSMAREEFFGSAAPKAAAAMPAPGPDLDELLKKRDEGFSQALLRLIDERGMKDSECYKRANIDRKLFSKIRSNPEYRPSKQTVFAFAVSLELSLPETKDLLRKAGFSLTRSSKFDIAMEYFIRHRLYDVHQINLVLFDYDMPLLGSGMN